MRINNLLIFPYSQQNAGSLKEKQSSPSFVGLTKRMKKKTYIDGQKDIKEFVDKRKDKSLMVGKLPGFMFAKLPADKKEEAIKEIYDAFDIVSNDLRDFDESKVYTIDEITKRRNKSTVETLENVLRKYNILGRWDDFDIVYLGKGGKGAGYKLEGLRDMYGPDEDEFIIKVFHMIEGENWQPYKSHGCYAEINSAQYWMNTVGSDTNRGKFFFGSLKSGYMVNKYVDDDVRLPKRNINPYRYGLKCTDEDALKKHNVCKGYSFDWGGVRVINRLKNGDKFARKIAEHIKNTPEEYRLLEWYKLLAKKTGADASKNAGLAMSIKHLDNKDYYIDTCLKLGEPKVNQGLAYVLKYLSYNDALKYFEKLVQTKDVITQVILFNEIPLLCMKHRDDKIKDDLQAIRSEILPARIASYYDIAEKYALPESIEHLASFVHLLPKDKFRNYYNRLAEIDNEALQDRLIYKLSNVSSENAIYVRKKLAEVVKNDSLKKKLLSSCALYSGSQIEKIKSMLTEGLKKTIKHV